MHAAFSELCTEFDLPLDCVNNQRSTGALHTRIPVSSDPFANLAIQRLSTSIELAAEKALLLARIDAAELAVMELFSLLAEHAPELLPLPWAAVFDVIAAEERLWVYPTASLGDIEDGTAPAYVPYLNRSALAVEWHYLLEHAQRVFTQRHHEHAGGAARD